MEAIADERKNIWEPAKIFSPYMYFALF